MGDEHEKLKRSAGQATPAKRPQPPVQAVAPLGPIAMEGDFSSLRLHGDRDTAKTPLLGGDLRLRLASFDGFRQGGARVTAEHRKNARFVAEMLTSWLTRNPGMRFTIIGHGSTDVGSRRANEIRRLLTAAKVPGEALSVDTAPLEAGAADNGLVEIKVATALPPTPQAHQPIPDIGIKFPKSSGPMVPSKPQPPSVGPAPVPKPGSPWRKDPDPLLKGKEPDETKKADAGDALKAATKLPAIDGAITLLKQVGEQRWREAAARLKAGEWIALGAVAATIAGGLVAGSIQDPVVGEFILDKLKGIRPSLKLPGADKIEVQFGLDYKKTEGAPDVGASILFKVTF